MGKEKTQTLPVIECNQVLHLSMFLSHFHFTVIEYFQFLLHYNSTTFYRQVFFTPLHLRTESESKIWVKNLSQFEFLSIRQSDKKKQKSVLGQRIVYSIYSK